MDDAAMAGLMPDDNRLANLRAALGFLQLPPREPELQLLHRWLDTGSGVAMLFDAGLDVRTTEGG